MDYRDYQLQNKRNDLHFWYKARIKLIFNLMHTKYKNFLPSRQILDIGCGTGTELKILSKFGSITTLDNNQDAINLVRKEGYETILGDIEYYNLAQNTYDCICCFDILEHIRNDQEVINKIYISLKENGYFIFTVPALGFLFSPHDRAMEHYRRYNKKEITKKLINANFKNIEIHYWNSILFPLVAVMRILKIIFYKLINIEKYHSEAKSPNIYINNILYSILNFENRLIAKNINLPFGLTIYGIAKK